MSQPPADAIRSGPIIVQTDTVFGLACLPAAGHVEAVFAAKQRPVERNLPVIVGDVAQLADLGVRVTDPARALAGAFWPGLRPRPIFLAISRRAAE